MNVKTWKSDEVTIEVDYDLCTGQAMCVDQCPGEVYELTDGKAVAAYIDQCIECCTCVAVCPEEAIKHSACE